MSRELENKARVTIDGKRYRMGNPNHPFNDLYESEGAEAVYRKMGLVDDDVVTNDYEALKGIMLGISGLMLAVMGVTCIGIFLGA